MSGLPLFLGHVMCRWISAYARRDMGCLRCPALASPLKRAGLYIKEYRFASRQPGLKPWPKPAFGGARRLKPPHLLVAVHLKCSLHYGCEPAALPLRFASRLARAMAFLRPQAPAGEFLARKRCQEPFPQNPRKMGRFRIFQKKVPDTFFPERGMAVVSRIRGAASTKLYVFSVPCKICHSERARASEESRPFERRDSSAP